MAPIDVRNPRTGHTDYLLEPITPDQLQASCQRVRTAQVHWHNAGLVKRIEALQSWKQNVAVGGQHRDNLLKALIHDTGRRVESVMEVDAVVSSIDRWCRMAPELMDHDHNQNHNHFQTQSEASMCTFVSKPRPTQFPFIQRQQQLVPYPLVGVISPWNFPLLLSLIDTIPALLAGCAVLVKPSEITPRFIPGLVESFAQVPLLCDVLVCVEGDGQVGAQVVDSVDLVCFTGGVETGKKVAEAAARRFIPVFLELGGKDPAIVLPSADLDQASSAIVWGSVVNAGQSCLSIERIYVHESVHDVFVQKLVEKAQRLELAYPSVDDGPIGPIIARRQADLIADHIEDSRTKGAHVLCGGHVQTLNGGLYCRPTVLTHVDHSMKVMVEESFAPIMPVMPFSHTPQAIAYANDATIYGLSAAVFTGDPAEAVSVAAQLQTGAVSVNDAGLTAFVHEAEKVPFKTSGLGGSRMGQAALTRFMRKKAILTKTNRNPDPWWYK